MDLRNRNHPTVQGKRELPAKKSTTIRPNTVAVAHCDKKLPSGLPDGSKSMAKIHPLGTIPKYLRKQKQNSASASSSLQVPFVTQKNASSSSSLQETFVTQSETVVDPTEPFEPVEPVSDVQLDVEHKQQTIDRLERQVQELLSELGFREQRIRELELSLYSNQQTLCQMQSMMQSHLKAQQPVMKRIPKENKILLLLQMILDSQTNGRQETSHEQDHEQRY